MTAPIRGVPGPECIRLQSETGAVRFGEQLDENASFAETLANALSDVSGLQDDARNVIEDFISQRREVSIQELMEASEKASLSLELLVTMRNTLTEAYRALMNMQT